MKGHKIRLLLLDLSFAGWCVLGVLSFGIGFFWIVPYYLQTMTNFYLDLIREFDIRVSFSPEGLAEAGRIRDFLKDTVVVSVGEQAGAKESEATEKPDAEVSADTAEDADTSGEMSVLDDKFFDE